MVTHPVNPMGTFRFTYENGIPSDVVYMYKVYCCTDNIPAEEDFVSIYTPVEYRDIPMYVYAKDNYIQIDVNFSEMERPVLTPEQKKRMEEDKKTIARIIGEADDYSGKMSFPERLLYKFKLWKAKLFNKDDLGF